MKNKQIFLIFIIAVLISATVNCAKGKIYFEKVFHHERWVTLSVHYVVAEPNNNEFEPKNASQERAMLEECLNMFLNLDSKVVKAEYNFRMVPLENTGHIEIEIDLRSGSELSSPHVNRVRCEHDKMLMMSMSHYIDRDGNEQICFLTYECSGKNVEPLYLRLLSKIKAAQG